ncbi:GNAT family N-acetyltransferase [Streptomyces sp. NPDC001307]|uniref:GNAT family N-acetyltransferase n=1 Tax=Streptomyces sp. NPDC001307 TaxID=3364560 RepID=UPI003675F2DC
MIILTNNTFSDETSRRASGPVVALATEHDREFLRSIFASSLNPFYDGDHEAHADRVLDAHLAAGNDSYGHFSVAQRTFVLWSDGSPQAQRLGVLHLAVKRQGTVKISPLILVPSRRRRDGFGSLLLRTALAFAWEQGARQLYCTVAAENTPAITFFTRHGFRIAGESPNQYKPGMTELILYRGLAPAGGEAPRDLHMRLFEEDDAAAVRDLILDSMPSTFQGVDDDWVRALFDGHNRRFARDLNQKYKIIHVAVDSSGAIQGTVAAGPKKGDPVKLMPLCAKSPEAFGFMLDEIPRLFGTMGRKLYTHLPASPATTALMQGNGWRLEGLMPAAYHPDWCTVQWSLSV